VENSRDSRPSLLNKFVSDNLRRRVATFKDDMIAKFEMIERILKGPVQLSYGNAKEAVKLLMLELSHNSEPMDSLV
jgi:hypothetical protein